MLLMFEADYYIIISESNDRDKKKWYNDDDRGDLECPFPAHFPHRAPLQESQDYI